MGLMSLITAIEGEILRLRWQVENLPAGSLDHAQLTNMLLKAERDRAAALRLVDGRN